MKKLTQKRKAARRKRDEKRILKFWRIEMKQAAKASRVSADRYNLYHGISNKGYEKIAFLRWADGLNKRVYGYISTL